MKTNYFSKNFIFIILIINFVLIGCYTSIKAQVPVKTRVFLQGPYESGTTMMRTDLISLDSFPTMQPYNVFPWDYMGNESISNKSANVVDWVLLELRKPFDTIVDQRAALLLEDGSVVDTNLSQSVTFYNVDTGQYYIVVKHRNHLPVMSSEQISLPNMQTYDFSDTTNFPPYGDITIAMVELDPGIFGMIVGDINTDCEIKFSGPGNDRGLILQRIINMTGSPNITQTVNGFFKEDLTMDGILKYSGPGNDQSRIIQNIVTITGSGAITGVFDCEVPSAVVYIPCTPQPTNADAGPNQLNVYADSVMLMANTPVSGKGVWHITNGSGGMVSDSTDPNSYFKGVIGVTYTLTWTISTTCGSSSDNTAVKFVPCSPQPKQADAGPDQLFIQGNSTTMQANYPNPGNGQWTFLSGGGAVLSDSAKYNAVLFGLTDSTYVLEWRISTQCGSTADTVVISIGPDPSIPLDCGDTLVDPRDGQVYNTVHIGNQCWMADNLNIGVKTDGGQSNNGVFEKSCYGNNVSNCDIYGGLYQWDELMQYDNTPGSQGLCPSGWHVPTDEEWDTLEGFADNRHDLMDPVWTQTGDRGYDAGGNLKSLGMDYWSAPNLDATNATGFSSLPGGYKSSNGLFYNINESSYYWTSGSYNTNLKWFRKQAYDNASSHRDYSNKTSRLAVRCIKDTITTCSPMPKKAYAGPDQLGFQGSQTAMDANPPVYGNGYWTILSGSGGSFSDTTDPKAIFYGQYNESYFLLWTISTACKSTSDVVLVSFTPFTCGDDLVDLRDGQTYRTTHLGDQCWMADNLNYGTFTTSNPAYNTVVEKNCYGNDVNNCDVYGGLYSWQEMMFYSDSSESKGICPTGWHVPSDNEWSKMEGFLDSRHPIGDAAWTQNGERGYDVGAKLKAQGTNHWSSPNLGATNFSGFNSVPGGYKHNNGIFYNITNNAAYWTSDQYTNTGYAWYRIQSFDQTSDNRDYIQKNSRYSVRCIKDSVFTCNPIPQKANAGTDQIGIHGSYTHLEANDPVYGSGAWSIISGTGGSLSDTTDPKAVFSGQLNEQYSLVWTTSTACYSTSDSVFIRFIPFICGDSITDLRDGKRYATVHLGNQCWIAQNLNYGLYTTGGQSYNSVTEKTCYSNNEANCYIYGGLYRWQEMMDYYTDPESKGICPTGWHVPSEEEWNTLEGFADSRDSIGDAVWTQTGERGYDVAGELKDAGTMFWVNPNNGATDFTGFRSLPGGYKHSNNLFYNIGETAAFWTSNEYSNQNYAWFRLHTNTLSSANRGYISKNSMYSVRCIKDSIETCNPIPKKADAGPDQLGLQGSYTMLDANNPVYGTGTWNIISGTGGSLSDANDPKTIFHGQINNIYTLVWTASTGCYSTSDSVVVSFVPFVCGDSLVDLRDGKRYATTHLGDQCWMAQNLNIGEVITKNQSYNSFIEKACYGNNESNCDVYGGLYKWSEMMDYNDQPGSRGICPTGWHVPDEEEWNTLEGFADSRDSIGDALWTQTGERGYDVGGELKDTGTVYWNAPNNGATNFTNFSALPGGYLHTNNLYYNVNDYGFFWTSDQYTNTAYAWYRSLENIRSSSNKNYLSKGYGMSVRCVKDSIETCNPIPKKADAGPNQIGMQGTYTKLEANDPVYGNASWSVISGSGGSFSDNTDPKATFSGQLNETYTLVWTSSTACHTSTDTVMISFVSFNCGDALHDMRDNQKYATVHLGSQCWMAQNLNVGDVVSTSQAYNSFIEKACYGNNEINCDVYGGLYRWAEVMDYNDQPGSRGICPTGWHVPDEEEWNILEGFADSQDSIGDPMWEQTGERGTDAGANLKSTGTMYWTSPNYGATNFTGFGSLPGGYLHNNNLFYYANDLGYYWTSEQYSNNSYAWYRSHEHDRTTSNREYISKGYGLSVRCIKDSIETCNPAPKKADAGPHQLGVQNTYTVLEGNYPKNGTGSWTIINGAGGNLNDASDPNTLFNGQVNETYALEWSLTTACYTSRDTVIINFVTFSCGDSLYDYRDGQKYGTVEIGSQCWMSKNLNIGTMSTSQTRNGIIEKACYSNNASNCETYGGLYIWNEMMQYVIQDSTKGICPAGWHIPSDDEWKTLEGNVDTQYGTGDPEWDNTGERGLDAGGNLKATGTTLWKSPNQGATNSSGFASLPGGYLHNNGLSYNESKYGYYWSSTEHSNVAYSMYRSQDYSKETSNRSYIQKNRGLSVRCLRD